VVALGHEGVEVGQDLGDPAAGDEADQVEPVRADVGHGPQPPWRSATSRQFQSVSSSSQSWW
jgi:hypothetical protein